MFARAAETSAATTASPQTGDVRVRPDDWSDAPAPSMSRKAPRPATKRLKALPVAGAGTGRRPRRHPVPSCSRNVAIIDVSRPARALTEPAPATRILSGPSFRERCHLDRPLLRSGPAL